MENIFISFLNPLKTVNDIILLTLFEVSILEVVYGVSQQPPGPVDEVDGAGELVVGGGHVVDVPDADHADTGHVGVVDEGQSWLYENVLLRDQSLHCSSCLRIN